MTQVISQRETLPCVMVPTKIQKDWKLGNWDWETGTVKLETRTVKLGTG